MFQVPVQSRCLLLPSLKTVVVPRQLPEWKEHFSLVASPAGDTGLSWWGLVSHRRGLVRMKATSASHGHLLRMPVLCICSHVRQQRMLPSTEDQVHDPLQLINRIME